jgi:hypothetical protein
VLRDLQAPRRKRSVLGTRRQPSSECLFLCLDGW